VVLPSANCQSEACKVHETYDPKISQHAVEVNYDGSKVVPGQARDQINVAYGTGEIAGVFVEDKLCLGPSESAGAADSCVDKLRLVAATEMSDEPFRDFAFDGVVGLGLDVLALAPEMSLFGMLVKQGRLAYPSFGVFLADTAEETSEISFGGHNPELVRSELTWAPVAMPEEGHWQVRITRMLVDDKVLDFCADGQCRAVVDTGTSVLAVPTAVAGSLQSALEAPLREAAAKKPVSDCRLAQGATLYFELETGLTIALGPGEYAREAVEAESAATFMNGNATAASHCQPTLLPFDMEAPLGPKLFIWGEPVLRKYYTAYDWQEKRVGFALAAHSNNEVAAAEMAPRRLKPLLARPRS
jgi:hypothetical protein